MPQFSYLSLDRLNTCDPRLRDLFKRVVERVDCSVLEGHRTAERQEELLRLGRSKVHNSKHLATPAAAVDVAPYPIPARFGNVPELLDAGLTVLEVSKVVARFYALAGYVRGVADERGIGVRWGGDWDGDWDFRDQTFDDLVHYELTDQEMVKP